MTQFDFGSINPVPTTGTQLASYLNQWRDALATMHRGSTRPSYIQPGQAWIDDSADPVWIVKICVVVGPPAVDASILQVNRITGSGTLPVALGGTGGNTAVNARTALGLGPIAVKTTLVNSDIGIGVLTPDRFANGSPNRLIGFTGAGVAAEVDRSADIDPARRASALCPGSYDMSVYFMADSSIRAVGRNSQFSNGDPTAGQNTQVPQRIVFSEAPATPVASVQMNGLSGFALTTGGMVYAWGDNTHGQLGIGSTTSSYLARPIAYFRDNSIFISSIVPSSGNTVAPVSTLFLTTTGQIWGCGQNVSGELGDNSLTQRVTPVRCGSLSGMLMVSMSGYPHSVIAMAADHSLYSWGENSQGQLGLGDTLDHWVPAQIPSLTNAIKIVCVSGSDAASTTWSGSSFVLRDDNTLWATGYNVDGQLGQNNTTSLSAFTRITTFVLPVLDVVAAEGFSYSVAAIVDGAGGHEYWAWGSNDHGQLGVGDTTRRLVPTKPTVSFQGAVTSISRAGAGTFQWTFVRSGNAIWGTGYNAGGNIAVGDLADKSSFTPVVGINGTISSFIARGRFSEGGIQVLYTDGRVDIGGTNFYGELGTRENSIHHTPMLQPVRF